MFQPLLPPGITIEDLQNLLDRGWWAAWKGGRLDADGLPPNQEPGFVFEGERMEELGNLLQLHGAQEGYPFAGWGSFNRYRLE